VVPIQEIDWSPSEEIPHGRWFFLFGFAKNERSAIDVQELTTLQMTAEALLDMDLRSLEKVIQAGELTEICDEEESHTG